MLSGKMERDICNVCRRESNMECEVCGDSYCSKECQRLDYKRHRYICFPLPALKPSGEKQECENCKRLSVDCCDRCGFGYCSRKCQIENWECHRYICAPMPKLIKKTRVAVEQFEKAPTVGNTSTTITSPTVSNAIRHNEMQITRAAEQQRQGETSAAPTSRSITSFASRQDANENKARGAENKPMQQQRATTTSQHIPKSPNESNNTSNSSSNNNTQTQKPNTKFQRAEENAFVRCMGFSALNCIYLRNTNPDTDKEFSEIIKKIDEFGRNQHMPLKLSQLNAKSTVLVNVDDQWYRARVLERPESPNNISVQLLDLGEQRNATIKEIAGLSGEINALPIHTYYMYLRNVPKVPLKEKMKNFVMDFVGSTFKVKYNQPDKNGSKLELYPIGGGQKTFNQMILEFLFESEKDKMLGGNAEQQFVNGNERGGRAAENNRNPNKTTAATRSVGNNKHNGFENRKADNQNQTGSNSNGNKMYENRKNERGEVSRASAAPAKEKTPPPDMEKPRVNNEVPFKLVTLESDLNELAVTVLDYSNISNGYFGCIPKNLGVQLVDIQTFLGKMDIDTVPYKPKLNEYCLAMFEEEWYRAKCTKIEGQDSFKLFYIDFTNEETLSSKDIRKYPKECKFDCNTFVCVLSNFPKVVTPEQVKFAEDYFANNKFIKLNNIKCIEAPFYSADCFEVVQK